MDFWTLFTISSDCTSDVWNQISRLWYCKTLYFPCILSSRFRNVEISLHFNLAFSLCSTSIYLAFDGQTEFSRVFNFAILSYSQHSRKFDAREKYVFYSIFLALFYHVVT